MCKINLVLLLLLLIFCDTLLLYCLILIRTITAPGIPVRRNTLFNNTYVAFLDNILIWGDLDKEVRTRIFKILDRLRKKDLYYKLFKYYLKINKINFLKYLIDYNKLYINPN